MTIDAWLGADVSKSKFDVVVRWDGHQRAKVFQNTRAGCEQLVGWLAALGIARLHACLEATGRYGEVIAEALHDAGHVVSVVNPVQIHDFARCKLGRNKTDRLDAAMSCEFCRRMQPAAWTPPAAAVKRLRDLVRTREALAMALVEWRNRHGAGAHAAEADAAMQAVIERLARELGAVETAIAHTLATDPGLKEQHDLLISIPGIGTQTAAAIITELPGPGVLRNGREAAAYAGLSPARHESGATIHRPTRISRIGNAALRRILYFPAMTAMRCNPIVAALQVRLRAQNRLKPIQILVAAMRKLLVLCFGVLKTGQPFDPHWAAAARQPTALSVGEAV